MPLISPSALSRRQFLQAGVALAFATTPQPSLAADRPAAHDGLTTTLRAGNARIRMVGKGYPETEVRAYNGVEPGLVLRLRQGTPFHGRHAEFSEANLRFVVDSSPLGPRRGKPVILPAGQIGDRALIFFASPEEIGSFVKA
jgi:hypothetical protein